VAGVIAFVGKQTLAGEHLGDQWPRHDNILAMAWAELKVDETTGGVYEGMDLGRAPAVGAADLLDLGPPFPPPAERCALTAELSIIITSTGAVAARAAKMRCQIPRWLQRWNRLYTVVLGP